MTSRQDMTSVGVRAFDFVIGVESQRKASGIFRMSGDS